MSGSIMFHELLFDYLLFLPDIDIYDITAIICLLHYSCLSMTKINVWHSIEHWHIHWPVVCTTQNMHMHQRQTF